MKEVGICTDSSALFPVGAVDRLGITVVPIAITLDGEPFDAREDAIDDFYARLAEGARATTSQPSPGEFLEAYARVEARGAKEVLSIHLDARVSGTLGSAELAARDARIPVTVVDTRTVSFGVGVCVRAAAEAIASGASVRETAATVGRLGAILRNAFVARGGPAGRVSETPAFALLEFTDGKAEPREPCDTVGEAIEVMANRVFDENRPVRVGLGHAATSTEPAADALALSLASHPMSSRSSATASARPSVHTRARSASEPSGGRPRDEAAPFLADRARPSSTASTRLQAVGGSAVGNGQRRSRRSTQMADGPAARSPPTFLRGSKMRVR